MMRPCALILLVLQSAQAKVDAVLPNGSVNSPNSSSVTSSNALSLSLPSASLNLSLPSASLNHRLPSVSNNLSLPSGSRNLLNATLNVPTVPLVNITSFVSSLGVEVIYLVSKAVRTAQEATTGAVAVTSLAVSIAAGGTTLMTSISAMQRIAAFSYMSNSNSMRSEAGILSPVFFFLPSLDPLYLVPSPNSQGWPRPNSQKDPSVILFGLEQLSLPSEYVYVYQVLILCSMFVTTFVTAIPTFNVDPDPPDYQPGLCRKILQVARCASRTDKHQIIASAVVAPGCIAQNLLGVVEEHANKVKELPASSMNQLGNMEGIDAVHEAVSSAQDTLGGAADECTQVAGILCSQNHCPTVTSEPAPPPFHIRIRRQIVPLATSLVFSLSQLHYRGIAFATLYTLTHSTKSNAELCAWVVLVLTVIGFPLFMAAVLICASRTILDDRTVREELSEDHWVVCWTTLQGKVYYVNLANSAKAWEVPSRLQARCRQLDASPWEVRHGLDGLTGMLHCRSATAALYPVFGLLNTLVATVLVVWEQSQGKKWAFWVLVAAAAGEATFFSMMLPYVDESQSQRNVENIATAASLWFLTAAILCETAFMHMDSNAAESMFSVFSILSVQIVPCMVTLDQCLSKYQNKPEDTSLHHNELVPMGKEAVQREAHVDAKNNEGNAATCGGTFMEKQRQGSQRKVHPADQL